MKKYKTGLVLLVIALALLAYFFPLVFLHIAAWQKSLISLFRKIYIKFKIIASRQASHLFSPALFYGVLHALGPGHGKFIITSYLSTHESQLKQSTILSLLSSLMQGIVVITATTLLVVV